MLATYFVAVWVEDLFANAQMKGCRWCTTGKGISYQNGYTPEHRAFFQLLPASPCTKVSSWMRAAHASTSTRMSIREHAQIVRKNVGARNPRNPSAQSFFCSHNPYSPYSTTFQLTSTQNSHGPITWPSAGDTAARIASFTRDTDDALPSSSLTDVRVVRVAHARPS